MAEKLPSSFVSLLIWSSCDPSSSHLFSSVPLFLGAHVILFSFFSLRLAFANHVETWVRVILVMMASMIFSPLVGYGFFLCSCSQAFSVLVVSRVAFFLLVPPSIEPYLQWKKKKKRKLYLNMSFFYFSPTMLIWGIKAPLGEVYKINMDAIFHSCALLWGLKAFGGHFDFDIQTKWV